MTKEFSEWLTSGVTLWVIMEIFIVSLSTWVTKSQTSSCLFGWGGYLLYLFGLFNDYPCMGLLKRGLVLFPAGGGKGYEMASSESWFWNALLWGRLFGPRWNGLLSCPQNPLSFSTLVAWKKRACCSRGAKLILVPSKRCNNQRVIRENLIIGKRMRKNKSLKEGLKSSFVFNHRKFKLKLLTLIHLGRVFFSVCQQI